MNLKKYCTSFIISILNDVIYLYLSSITFYILKNKQVKNFEISVIFSLKTIIQ